MRKVPLSEIRGRLSECLRQAEAQEIIIPRHGKPAGLLVGCASEDESFDCRLEHDPSFLASVACARQSPREGKGMRIEDLPEASQ